uniref:putative bifunctional diguanylate cyclase/phosphodiesterase n=1 Tax=Pararhizobium sp. IMCC3301 TaxID=3067904 RepID=UPI0027426B53|nr:EAL domain-containing protein [Pararhizobium sp. IMCC3301]
MFGRLQNIPLLYLIIASISVVLLTVQVPGIVSNLLDGRAEIEQAAVRQATAAIDMLEAVHIQSMTFRGQTQDGDPAIETLNGSMEQFSNDSKGVRLWLFMGQKVIDYQIAAGESEIERPLDSIDELTISSGQEIQAFENATFRLSRPVIMGEGHASSPRCAECHTVLMNIQKGEIIGGYSSAVDLSIPLAHWRSNIIHNLAWGFVIFALTIAAIFVLLKTFALRPLNHLSLITERLAAGDTEVEIDLDKRQDSIGSMARALRVFRDSLKTNGRLEAANKEAQNELRFLALHDALTGLPNRASFGKKLDELLVHCRENNEKVTVFCLDMDYFKEVNDTLGHAAGDKLLLHIGDRLRLLAGTNGIAARFGGDEFSLVIPATADTNHVKEICEGIVAISNEHIELDGRHVKSTFSIGVAMWPIDGEDAEKLLRNADTALYQAKADGRNTYRFFSSEMNAAIEQRRELESELRQAFAARELELHYQPLVDVRSQRIIGVEALMRWNHSTKGWIGPATFIPVAEECGLIGSMGRWLLETSCRQAALWPDIVLSVNISPVQFKEKDFAAFIKATLEQTGLQPERLELEITEGLLMDTSANALDMLLSVKQLGVKIAMDDFGTGYSSLGYLQSFPFDKIKIDRSFVSALTDDRSAAAIVRSVVGLGQSLGIATTAEGVETIEQLSFLQAEGCDQVQGYYFAKPQDPLHITALLGTWQEKKRQIKQSETRAPKRREKRA